MRIKLTGKDFSEIQKMLPQFGMEQVDENPDVILTYGGDGTLLGAEREFPGIPKFPLRDITSAHLCDEHSHELQLEAFAAGEIPLKHLKKLEASCGDHHILALNDIYIHNEDQASALRYQVWIDDQLYAEEIAGDAVGLSSVHGSSAYYRSITHSVFRVGLGLAFSNSMEVVNHMVISEKSQVKIRIIRGPGMLIADNAPERRLMNRDDEAIIKQSDQEAVIYGLDNFMCPKCRFLRHCSQYPYGKMMMR